MRKNRATRLANRIGSIIELEKLLKPLAAAAEKAEGRDKLPTRRKVETHMAAIEILLARHAAEKFAKAPKAKKVKPEPTPEPIPEPPAPKKAPAKKVAKKAPAKA